MINFNVISGLRLFGALAIVPRKGGGVHGAVLYVGARAIYIFLYAFGVPVARSLAWLASLIGIGLILAALVI